LQENHAVLAKGTTATPIVHISAVALLNMFKQYLPPSALGWTKKTAQRDIAPIRNASLILSKYFEAGHVLLVDDDITGFDIRVTRDWVTHLVQTHCSVVVGAHIGGLDETDVISRLAQGIERACSCTNTGGLTDSVRQLFTVTPKAGEIQCEVENVSGGYLSFRFASSDLEPFPPGYNEDWLWCLSLKGKNMASVFRIPQVVTHDPPLIREPSENDLLFELCGDVAFKRELDHYRACERARMPASDVERRMQQNDHKVPDIWVEELLTQVAKHKGECGAFISKQFRAFGLTLVGHMYAEGRFHLDWNHEFDSWKTRWERNRNSFCEAVNSPLMAALISRVIKKGRM
jgi:hypothetical protein